LCGGNGVKVIVLGAGPGGLAAAYELMKQGYDVQVIEARERVGGHVWTVRRGAVSHEYGGQRQECTFDEGHFYDSGAWRIPYSHRGVLHYCKEFQIPLQPHKNINLNAYLYLEGIEGTLNKKPVRIRQLRTDMAGYTNELLAKVVNRGQLNQQLTDEDAEELIDYLVNEGLLTRKSLTYDGSYHRGYETLPGAGKQPGNPSEPFNFAQLLPFAAEAMRTAGYYLASTASFDQQETMLQPVGGMSTIYEDGFQQALGDRIVLNTEVTEIRQNDQGVRIVVRNVQNDQTREVTGDYCVCTIPLSVLQNIPSDFQNDMAHAITQVPYLPVGKIGLQFKRRFWEEDDWIYGGMSFTNIDEIGTVAYPDYNYQSNKGVIQGYYNFGATAVKVSRLPLERRTELALRHGGKLHPQYREEFETAFSVAWHRMPYSLGGWADYSERVRSEYYGRLLEPDGRIFLAGGHLSYLTGWMEGAIQAAWLQVEKLHQRAAQQMSASAY
jgi:monoamine oxidase